MSAAEIVSKDFFLLRNNIFSFYLDIIFIFVVCGSDSGEWLI